MRGEGKRKSEWNKVIDGALGKYQKRQKKSRFGASRCRIKTFFLMSSMGGLFTSFLSLASSLPFPYLSLFFSLFLFSEGLSSISGAGDTEEKVTRIVAHK